MGGWGGWMRAVLIILFFAMAVPAQAFIARTATCDESTKKCTSVNSEGRQDFVEHAHPDSSQIHFHVDGIAATTRYILVDISNTGTGDANYKHVGTSYIHLENMDIQVDSTTAGAYKINLIFLNNVDATNGDAYTVWHLSGTNQTGNQKEVYQPWYPNGIRALQTLITTGEISLNDTNYQTDVALASTIDSGTANVFPADGDIILEVIISAGSIDVSLNSAYHSH